MRLFVLFLCFTIVSGHVRRELRKAEKQKLAQALRMGDEKAIEARRTRLEKLGRRMGRQGQTVTGKDVPLANITSPPDNGLDLFELNESQGVAAYLFQADMHLTEAQLADFENSLPEENGENNEQRSRKKRQISTVYKKWIDGKVYYYLDASLNARKLASIAAALEYISSKTCITFIQSKTAANRIKVFNGVGCYSSVGMVGGEQTLSIGDGCEVIGTVAHEFTHALGVFHMQSRSDRDDYLTVALNNIQPESQYNFAKYSSSQTINYTPYEYGSFMHYGANAFATSSSVLSLIADDPAYTYTMGNRQISFYDITIINKHYGCEARCSPSTSAKCLNGGTPNPITCTQCLCPVGYGGITCGERPSGCGATLPASSTWQSVKISLGENTQTSRDTFSTCNHWITAPTGKPIEVRITAMSNPQCNYGCAYNGIEIKTKSDQKIVNPRVCCPEIINTTYSSSLNPTPVVSYNRYYLTTFNIDYRYVLPVSVDSSTDSVKPNTTTTTTTTKTPPKPTTTTTTTRKPTTTTRPANACKNMNTNTACSNLKASGFCTSTANSIDTIKYNCAVTCGLCGKTKQPCKDVHPSCNLLQLSTFCSSDYMYAEYYCASSCGFCTNPV